MNDRWIPDPTELGGVKYVAIADALAQAIDTGVVKAGDRLPPQRHLADRLGVDLTTVTRAYEAARLRGFIEGRGRSGSYVRDPSKAEVPRRQTPDAGMNMPPELPRDILGRTIAQTISELMSHNAASSLQYQPAGGAREDRIVGAELLTRLGVSSVDDDVLISSGGQSALSAIMSALFDVGDAIACGSHVYPGFRAIAERLGLRLIALPRIDAEALRRVCTRGDIKALYLVPTNDNPTAATLTASERQAIAHVAEEQDVQIIEDDAYGALAASPIAPVASYVPHRTWYIASTSKIISPALRVAFLRAPNMAGGLRLASILHETTIMAPPLNVALVSAWISNGTFDQLLAKMRDESAKRQQLASELLAGLDVSSHPEGYHLWLRLPSHLTGRNLADLMRPTGLSVIPSERFAVGDAGPEAVRVSFGGSISPDRLRSGLMRLRGYADAPTNASQLV
ncbi:PLP-dependent aminotransferase family protein [Sphingomonas sp. ST-64]|uniref:PLP-dependent aminotransferase family protein n=1 Tax=Sphingomonas plantiphila TaxID=3163295 RepID=A0ABW8YI66_9SPHN